MERKLVEYTGSRVIIMACSSCNLNCSHCYIGYQGDFTVEKLRKIATHFIEQGKLVRIDGAEVLINPDYLDVYKLVDQDWIMTNGVAILKNPQLIQRLKDCKIKNVYTSYHFNITEELNTISTERLNEVIKLLNKADINVILMVTITQNNIKDIKEMCDEAYKLGTRGIEFNKIFLQGKARGRNNLLPTEEELITFFKDLKESRDKYDINEFVIRRSGTFGKDRYLDKNNFRCSCGVRKVTITPDGKVYGCTCMSKPGYEVGELIDGRIYLYGDYENDRSWCMADKCGVLGKTHF